MTSRTAMTRARHEADEHRTDVWVSIGPSMFGEMQDDLSERSAATPARSLVLNAAAGNGDRAR